MRISGVRGWKLRGLLAALLAPLSGCAMRVTPPTHVPTPATVFLVDTLHHSSLILPQADGSLREYAYGEWHWFARNHRSLLDVFRILLLPNSGTLGRRDLPALPSVEALRAEAGAQAVYEIEVARDAAARLLAALDARFSNNAETPLFNPQERLSFVRDERNYWSLYNCNSAVADWLEALGCDVAGQRLFAQFSVESRRPALIARQPVDE